MSKFIFCLFGAVSLFAKPFTYKDLKIVNDKMFAYHVLFDSYDRNLANRSVKKIIATLDPVYFYFLNEEKNTFNGSAERMVGEYDNGTFDTYIAIQETFIQSVKRCRRIRAQVRFDIIQSNIEIETFQVVRPVSAPGSEIQQQRHIEAYMVTQLQNYAENRGITQLTFEDKIRVLDYYERKMRAHEEKYLSPDAYPLVVSKMIASSLDAHSMVYAEEEISHINAHLKSKLEGIGIYVADGIDGPIITGCVKSGPAERSKLVHAGDRILYIGGVNISSVSFEKTMNLLSVRNGNQIVLKLQSKSGQVKSVKLYAEKITVKGDKISVDCEPYLDGQIVKLRVDTFYDDFQGSALAGDLKNIIWRLRKEKKVYGIVIDMRRNLGGFFKEAVKSIALFCPQGTVVVAKFRNDQVRYSKEFDPHVSYVGPIVILTSQYSASAAEILAQSLQDVGVAIIAGDETTYGKGSIQFQTITDPRSAYKYKVTVGKYYTVSGISTQLKGVSADIVVPSEFANRKIGERYLSYALPSGDLNKLQGLQPDVQQIFDYQNTRKKTAFEIMKPRLQKNSKQRIAKNKNYQAFLKTLEGKNSIRASKEEKRKALYGTNDLQMTEAVYIIKDMHAILQTYR